MGSRVLSALEQGKKHRSKAVLTALDRKLRYPPSIMPTTFTE